MKILPVVALFIIAHSAEASSGEPPRGEWRHTDIRSIEILPGGACIRLWIEERTYNIVPAGDSRFSGTYFNVIRAAPVGAPSFRAECKFPPPADNPVATQIRGWSIIGNKTPEQAWRVRAQPGLPGGDLRVFKTEEFETKLYRRGDHLVDSNGSANPDEALLFRPPSPSPASARTALEETVRRLHGGFCLEVMLKLAPGQEDAVRELCSLRQRMTQIAGSLLSISVDSATELDRVPVGFPRTPSNGYRRQRGVFFSFLGRYEKQQIPGHAVVVEEEGAWRVDLLWF